MKVKDLMTKNLVKIDVNEPLRNAIKLMEKKGVSKLVVTRHKKIDGILTEKDLIRRLGEEKERKLSDAHIYVSSCYTRDLITIGSESSIKEAAKLMISKGISTLLVKEGEDIVGIITYTDIIKTLKDSKVRVGEAMTKKVVTLNSDSSLLEARKIMLKKNVKRIPIMERGRLIGMITEKDIAKALDVFRKTSEGKQWDEKMKKIRIYEVIKRNIITVKPNETIGNVVKIMLKKNISGIPVVDNEKIVGIITKRDLVKYIALN